MMEKMENRYTVLDENIFKIIRVVDSVTDTEVWSTHADDYTAYSEASDIAKVFNQVHNEVMECPDTQHEPFDILPKTLFRSMSEERLKWLKSNLETVRNIALATLERRNAPLQRHKEIKLVYTSYKPSEREGGFLILNTDELFAEIEKSPGFVTGFNQQVVAYLPAATPLCFNDPDIPVRSEYGCTFQKTSWFYGLMDVFLMDNEAGRSCTIRLTPSSVRLEGACVGRTSNAFKS